MCIRDSAYLMGGISAAIQTNQDLYRQNNDIDIMCNEGELSRLVEILQKIGYSVDDRRGIKTRNVVDSQGHFQAIDHELNAYTKNKNMLGVGISVSYTHLILKFTRKDFRL